MISVQKLNICYARQLFNYNVRNINIFKRSSDDKVKDKSSSEEEAFDILEELREPEITEEEILKKRFKSRLPEMVYKKFVKKQYHPLENRYDFQTPRLRRCYATFGNDSGLNPGVCWPSREQMLELIECDKIFEPPLEVRMKNVTEARLAEEKRLQDVEAEVDKNMANLDRWIAEFNQKREKKAAEALALKKKKEKLIDEVSEYLGYAIDSRDPRFQEAIEQKEKEQKKALKAKKQQESYDKMISKLKQMAEK